MRAAKLKVYKSRKNGRFYWALRSPWNGNIIADCAEGDGYPSRAACRKGFAAVARYAAGAVEK